MPRPPLSTGAVLALLLVVGAGCGADRTDPTDPAAGSSPSAAASTTTSAEPSPDGSPRASEDETGSAAVPESLRFTATTVTGEPLDGASLAGRPTLFWFWAPWCPICRSQVPQVEGLAAEHAGELQVIGIGSLDSADAIRGFAEDVSGVTHLEDVDGALWQRFGITEQSSFVLLDAEGERVFESGYGGSDELGDAVDETLG